MPRPLRSSYSSSGAAARAALTKARTLVGSLRPGEPSTPLEQAYPLVFLCSDAAAGVNGITMVTDAGYGSAGATGAFEPATGVVEFMTQLHLE